jgi:hypothetical protein
MSQDVDPSPPIGLPFDQFQPVDKTLRRPMTPDGGVLDLDLTALDRQAEFIAINKQPNDDVVHLDRFRKTDRLAHQTLDTCA